MTRRERVERALRSDPVLRYLRRALMRREEAVTLWAGIVHTFETAEGSRADRNRVTCCQHGVSRKTVWKAKRELGR